MGHRVLCTTHTQCVLSSIDSAVNAKALKSFWTPSTNLIQKTFLELGSTMYALWESLSDLCCIEDMSCHRAWLLDCTPSLQRPSNCDLGEACRASARYITFFHLLLRAFRWAVFAPFEVTGVIIEVIYSSERFSSRSSDDVGWGQTRNARTIFEFFDPPKC